MCHHTHHTSLCVMGKDDSIKYSDRTIDAFIDVTDVLCGYLHTVNTKYKSDGKIRRVLH